MVFHKKVLARIDAKRALKHIENVSEGIGPRIAGAKEERELNRYGYDGENGVATNIINCGLGLDSSNFPEEVKGNISLIQREAISFSDKAINAVAAGVRLGNKVLSIHPRSSFDHALFGDLVIPTACFILGDESGKIEDAIINTNISLDRLQ